LLLHRDHSLAFMTSEDTTTTMARTKTTYPPGGGPSPAQGTRSKSKKGRPKKDNPDDPSDDDDDEMTPIGQNNLQSKLGTGGQKRKAASILPSRASGSKKAKPGSKKKHSHLVTQPNDDDDEDNEKSGSEEEEEEEDVYTTHSAFTAKAGSAKKPPPPPARKASSSSSKGSKGRGKDSLSSRDDGDIPKRNKRGPSFTKEEYTALARAFVNVSQDATIGTDQSSSVLWKKIYDKFLALFENDLSDIGDQARARTPQALKNKWHRNETGLKPMANVFSVIRRKINAYSGALKDARRYMQPMCEGLYTLSS